MSQRKPIAAKIITIDPNKKTVAALPYGEGVISSGRLEPTNIPLSAFGPIKLKENMSFNYILDDKGEYNISDVNYET